MDNTVALSAIGLAASAVAGVVWIAKYTAKELSKDLQEHTKAAMLAAQASTSLEITVKKVGVQAELSAKNSQEQLTFMKNLNGKLAKATIQTVQEQNVQHQNVQHQTVQHTEITN